MTDKESIAEPQQWVTADHLRYSTRFWKRKGGSVTRDGQGMSEDADRGCQIITVVWRMDMLS